jgi:hypothetical protein
MAIFSLLVLTSVPSKSTNSSVDWSYGTAACNPTLEFSACFARWFSSHLWTYSNTPLRYLPYRASYALLNCKNSVVKIAEQHTSQRGRHNTDVSLSMGNNSKPLRTWKLFFPLSVSSTLFRRSPLWCSCREEYANGNEPKIPVQINSGFYSPWPLNLRVTVYATALSNQRVCLTLNLKGDSRRIHLPRRPTSLTLLKSYQNVRLSQYNSISSCSN